MCGASKPDRGVFLVFSECMGVDPERVIYVSDNLVEDVSGALAFATRHVLCLSVNTL